MSFVNDIFDKQNHQRRGNFASQDEHTYAHQDNHFQKHREWQGECRNDHDSKRIYHHGGNAFANPTLLLRRLVHSKTLLALIGFILVVVLGLAVAAFVYLLPMVSKLLGYVDINNWQGMMNQGVVMLQKILAGAKGA